MLGKMDPKKIQEMMKKLNMNVQQIDADEVIIKAKGRNIVISRPEVMLTNMMGKDVYQVTGEVSEAESISEKDIEIVMEKTGKDRDAVVKTLERLDNDLARAVMELKKKD